MSAWSVAEVVAHAPAPVIGSNGAAIADDPAVGRMVCGASPWRRTSPGASAAQLPAVYGPPDAAAFGHVCVYVVTPWKGRRPMPLT